MFLRALNYETTSNIAWKIDFNTDLHCLGLSSQTDNLRLT